MSFLAPAFAFIGGGSAAAGAGIVGATAGIVGAGAGIAGTLMSVQAQRQAAAQQQQIAQYNYTLATQQAQLQAAIAEQQAAQNAGLLDYQARVQQGNATSYLQQASAVLKSYNQAAEGANKAAALNAARERDNARRFLALQMAKVGASGFLLSGTPLDSLADAASTLELQAQDIYAQGDLEARKLHELGSVEAYRLRGAARSETQNSAITLFQAANERWGGRIAEQKLKLDLYGAQVARLGGQANAAGLRLSSAGTLFQGVANLGKDTYDLYRSGAFTGFKAS